MFGSFAQFGPLPLPDTEPKDVPPPTVLRFPQCVPRQPQQAAENGTLTVPADSPPLVNVFQKVRRPADIQLAHFEALGLHVMIDAAANDIIPDPSFLPRDDDDAAGGTSVNDEIDESAKVLLSNGKPAPPRKTYLERRTELSVDNISAFRNVRRISAPAGQPAPRLGNAYEFFKNLEAFSTYWIDTSLPPADPGSPPDAEPSPTEAEEKDKEPPKKPLQRTHVRIGDGAQMPFEFRQQLIHAFVKLVAYDFGCNVHFSRHEPRVHLHPSDSSLPPSYFNSGASFIYRTPLDRAAARHGVVEGPVAALSCRSSIAFPTDLDSRLDFGREVIALLLTAQHRAREGKAEHRFGEGKWWTTKPRWGGGPGGPIGREVDTGNVEEKAVGGGTEPPKDTVMSGTGGPGGETRTGPAPKEAPTRRKRRRQGGNLQMYDNYRKLAPPSATWDSKTLYRGIGKAAGQDAHDDIFLISALNHHVSIIRARVPISLLRVLDGDGGATSCESRDVVPVYRSKWFDLFVVQDRLEALRLIWGMMAYQTRSVE